MLNFLDIAALVGTFTICVACYWFMIRLRRSSNHSWLKRKFVIEASKSSSAVLLGGIPLILGTILLTLYQGAMDSTLYHYTYIGCLIFIMIFGYLDDRYELRSIVKLFFQIVFLSVFSLVAANELNFSNSSLAFLAIFTVGLASVNGANFLDGLDGMSVKIALSTLFVLGLYSHIHNYSELSFLCVAYSIPVFAFYLFNKFPASIHLGESGGSSLGLTTLYLGLSFLKHSNNQETVGFWGLILITIPVVMSVTEAIVTTLRRLLVRRSPFIGDQFHIHHILHFHRKLSINHTTTVLAFFNTLVMTLSLTALHYIGSSSLVAISSVLFCVSVYFTIGWKVWFGIKNTTFLLKTFFKSMKKEKILLINSSLSDSFQVKVYEDINEDNSDEKFSA